MIDNPFFFVSQQSLRALLSLIFIVVEFWLVVTILSIGRICHFRQEKKTSQIVRRAKSEVEKRSAEPVRARSYLLTTHFLAFIEPSLKVFIDLSTKENGTQLH